jgi:hypothetical protein
MNKGGGRAVLMGVLMALWDIKGVCMGTRMCSGVAVLLLLL